MCHWPAGRTATVRDSSCSMVAVSSFFTTAALRTPALACSAACTAAEHDLHVIPAPQRRHVSPTSALRASSQHAMGGKSFATREAVRWHRGDECTPPMRRTVTAIVDPPPRVARRWNTKETQAGRAPARAQAHVAMDMGCWHDSARARSNQRERRTAGQPWATSTGWAQPNQDTVRSGADASARRTETCVTECGIAPDPLTQCMCRGAKTAGSVTSLV